MKKKEKIQLICIGAVVALTLLLLAVRSGEKDTTERIWIERPQGGTKKQELSLVLEEKEEALTLEVNARERTEEEREAVFSETLRYLRERLKVTEGDRITAEQSLLLPQYLPETGADIRWDSMEEEILSSDGTVKREGLDAGEEVVLRAYISYGEETREYWFYVTVLPYETGSAEARFYRAKREIQRLEEETVEAEGFYLPEEVSGVTVRLPKEKFSMAVVLAVLLLFLPFAVMLSKRQEREKEQKKREGELMEAYPRLITKLTMYTGAGLSLRGAWERLATDYREQKKDHKKKSAVNEEIILLAGELKNGTPEASAYEDFGRRIGLKPYLRCASLLVSQLQKGSGGLRESLENEVRLAFELQREQAEKKGEEAQTKLLFPMMGMLFLVMAVVLIPAFFSM
ncbi:MAG: type II secretion system F family protein [Lachnospiraceae bacterium]|nr:type II secretion system F family protein [Lachnospiraceae bacterium]